MAYRYLIHGYLSGIFDRQILGIPDTLAATAVLCAFVGLCAAPSLIWSRTKRHPWTWRGVECFACYALTALALGAVLAAFADDGWSALDALSLGGGAFARITSMAFMLAVFMVAAWWGGKSASGRRRRVKAGGRRKGMEEAR